MNAPHRLITTDGQPSPLVYGEERDNREDWEKCRDLILAHLANQDRLTAIVNSAPCLVDCAAFNAAEDACEDSRASMEAALEDLLNLPADKIGRALS